MTAQNGEGVYGDGAGVVTPLAHKLSQNGPLVKDSTGKPRSGVFYAGNASLVTGKANMSYDVAAFEAAICRGRTKGTSFPTNDAVVNVTTTAAPGSNSRIDIIYLQQQEVSEGDVSTQAVVGVVQGTASSSPAAPTLPDGAIELARAVVPAGITATTSATITQTAPFTTTVHGAIPVRNATDLSALGTSFNQGQLAYQLDAGFFAEYLDLYNASTNPGGADVAGWYPVSGMMPQFEVALSGTNNVTGTEATVTSYGTPRSRGATFSFSSGVLTLPFGGLWLIEASGTLNGISNAERWVRITKNGTTNAIASARADAAASWGFDFSLSQRVRLAASDTVRLRASQQTGSTIGMTAISSDAPTLRATYLGPA